MENKAEFNNCIAEAERPKQIMEDFVPFEIAKKLKEKGFRGKVNAYYGKHENIFDVHPALDMNDCDYRASAPTISQALKWLREEKNMMVFPAYSKNTSKWYCFIINADSLESYNLSLDDSYEDAALSGIEYALNNLV